MEVCTLNWHPNDWNHCAKNTSQTKQQTRGLLGWPKKVGDLTYFFGDETVAHSSLEEYDQVPVFFGCSLSINKLPLDRQAGQTKLRESI